MPRLIAFLRAVNVGGRTVKMDALRTEFEALGFTDVETFIASGNVIFKTPARNTPALARKIEAHLLAALGLHFDTFVRSSAEVVAIAGHQPFSAAAMAAAGALNVGFLADPLDTQAVAQLDKLKTGIDDFHTHGRELYWLCQKKQSESTFSNAVFEKQLKLKATFRGINTVRKLAEKYPG